MENQLITQAEYTSNLVSGVCQSESLVRLVWLVCNPVWIYTVDIWVTQETFLGVLFFVNEATPSHHYELRLLMWLIQLLAVGLDALQ